MLSRLRPLPALVVLVASFVLDPSASAGPPNGYELDDVTSGSGSNGTGSFELIGGHVVRVRAHGTPGRVVWLLLSPNPAPIPAPVIGGTPLGVDPGTTSILVLGTLPASGGIAVTATVPNDVPFGAAVHTQVAYVGGALDPRLSAPIVVSVGCGDEGPTFVQSWTDGSSSTSFEARKGIVATVNDPAPKLIGPGYRFSAAKRSMILFASTATPTQFTHAYAWSGGDELCVFRDQLAVDGSTPGIDRVFFVASGTPRRPNFIDWDGAQFANETTLAAAPSSLVRITATTEGDLIAVDALGSVVEWDKQSGYALTVLFQLQNAPSSVDWGAFITTTLGRIAVDPATGWILLPVNNPNVSNSGQIYAFDRGGVRQLVDLDVMGVNDPLLSGVPLGVTVDRRNTGCRVYVHGGGTNATFYVARYTARFASKRVRTSVLQDRFGGASGVILGDDFWTNTNDHTWGLVRRTLPIDW